MMRVGFGLGMGGGKTFTPVATFPVCQRLKWACRNQDGFYLAQIGL